MPAKRTRRQARRPRAATADIVGTIQRNDRVPAKWKKHYTQLLRMRNNLLRQQGELVKDTSEQSPSVGLHIADAATDSYDRDLVLTRISLDQDMVYEIDQALARIRSGAYGVCELTGKRIERLRLEAIPWTRFCAAAEKQLEREGAVRPARLAPREKVTDEADQSEGALSLEEKLEQEE